MRVTWVGKAASDDGEAGDEVFDRRTVAAIETAGHRVTQVAVTPLPRAAASLNLVRGVPVYRARYASAGHRAIARAVGETRPDVVICSWEPLDILVPLLPAPVILIAHNVTSAALTAIFPHSPTARLAARRALAWERGLYRSDRLAAIAVLSVADHRSISRLASPPEILLTIPGMPPARSLVGDATIRREIHLEGTYDWRPKRRDLHRFAVEWSRAPDRWPVIAAGLPAEAAGLLRPRRHEPERNAGALTFGLVTDRFAAGHKLKTLAYVAQNRIVLSYAPIKGDFRDVPEADLFLHEVSSCDEVDGIASRLASLEPAALSDRWRRFQDHCARSFSWARVAETLMSAADRTRNSVLESDTFTTKG